MTHWSEKPGAIALAFALLVTLTQAGGLAREVIDWDESTFILLASRLLDGHLPYVDLFDNKPPLIFFTMSAVMAVFGETLLSVRLFGDLCILVIVLLTVAILKRFIPLWPAVASGVLLICVYAVGPGQHTSTELPAMAMIMGALLLLLRARGNLWAVAGAGALIALATLTRTNLAVVAVMIGAYLVVAGLFLPRSPVRKWAIVPYTIAGFTPLFAFVWLYWQAGALDTFILSTLTVPLSYADNQMSMAKVFWLLLRGWFELTARFPLWTGPFTVLVIAGCGAFARCLIDRSRTDQDPATAQEIRLICLFAVAVLMSVLVSGAAYAHYWLHFYPFIAMLMAPFLVWAWPRDTFRWAVIGLVCVTMLSGLRHNTPNLVRLLIQPDFLEDRWSLRNAAERIGEVIQPGDNVWAVNNHLILWYLDKTPVSPVIAHPSNITRTAILRPLVEAGYAPDNLLGRVYDSRPAFIVNNTRGTPSYLRSDPVGFETYLSDHYAVFFEQNEVIVYRLLGHDGWEG